MLALLTLIGLAFGASYWETGALLADMFPQADTVEPVVLHLDATERSRATALLGYEAPSDSTFYVAKRAGQIQGYVLVDDQLGQHEPITFAVQLDPAGVVLRQEIVVYRESRGDEIRHPRFRSQFEGMSAADPMVPGQDVLIISGATYSSKAMAVGVKRAAVLSTFLIEDQAALSDGG